MRRPFFVAAIAATVVVLLGVPAAGVAAVGNGPKDPQVADGTARAAAAATCEWPVNATNSALQTKTITSSEARYKADIAWSNLECGALTVTVPPGMRAGLVVRTDAEVTCTGSSPDQTEWCLGRVLVNGLEAFPRELEADGSFSWAQSSPDFGAWESAAFTRSTTLTCMGNVVCSWNVQVQVRNHAEGLSFRIDGSTVEAQLTYYPIPR